MRIFYIKMLNGLFYTNSHSAIICLDHLDLRRFHALQMMIPKYLPSLFADNPLTDNETALLKSTGKKSSAEYETLIEEFAKSFDMRSEIIRGKLAGFETAFERIRADDVRKQIRICQETYEGHISAMQVLYQTIQDHQYILAGLECAINCNSGSTELMEYFMCNKNLSLVKVIGTAIEFIVHGYADVFSEDAFNQYAGNHDGYMYSRLNSNVTKAQMEKLYRSIFSDGKYMLRMCAAYTADIRTGLKALSNYVFPPESQSYLPNPHIQRHGCTGNFAARFQEYMRKHDYVGAIDQAAVSARNLNFYDSTVISAFASDLSGTAVKCIEKEDGTLLTPREAIIELEGGALCQGPLF